VDLPFLPGTSCPKPNESQGLTENQVCAAGDAWLGFFKSLDGGKTWTSTLVPGYPQDQSPAGLSSPSHGFQAGTDPVIRAGTNGMFYYAGLVFNRTSVSGGNFGASSIVVSRYIDNNSVIADPIQFLDSSVVASGNAPHTFTDKPWIAVDIPRVGAANCTVTAGGQQQSFPGGNVYVTYTVFQTDQYHGAITFQRSTDCGATWGQPVSLTDALLTRQGSAIAIDPNTGFVYVAWRQFAGGVAADGIYIAKSTDGGQTFSPPQQIASIVPFDQGSSQYTFRTNSYPAIVVDGGGRVYVAWSQRGVGPGGDARIVLSTSTDGTNWTSPSPINPQSGRGHQIMPAIAFAGGLLMAAYYDFRNDSTVEKWDLIMDTGGVFSGTPIPEGDLLISPSEVFSPFVDDTPPRALRHTVDVFLAQALPAAVPIFNSIQVSTYQFGSLPVDFFEFTSGTVVQTQFDPPNFPMFAGGTQAYIGDYLDVTALQFVRNSQGNWIYNTAADSGTVFHVTWTDNRDVRPPADGD
jgi:hypothetical protein